MHTRRQISILTITIATGGCISTFRETHASVSFYNSGTEAHNVRTQLRNAETDEIIYETEQTLEVEEGKRPYDELDVPPEGIIITTSLDGSVVDEREISSGFADVQVYINQDDEVEIELMVR